MLAYPNDKSGKQDRSASFALYEKDVEYVGLVDGTCTVSFKDEYGKRVELSVDSGFRVVSYTEGLYKKYLTENKKESFIGAKVIFRAPNNPDDPIKLGFMFIF